MYAALFTDGHLTLDAIQPECVKGAWAPVCTLKESQTVILFHVPEMVYKFCNRNYPKSWARGAVFLTEEDFAFIEKQGWKTEVWSFPKKLPLEKLGFEIVELAEEPDLLIGHKSELISRRLQV